MKNTLFSHHSGRPFGQAGRTLVHVLAEVMVQNVKKGRTGARRPGSRNRETQIGSLETRNHQEPGFLRLFAKEQDGSGLER